MRKDEWVQVALALMCLLVYVFLPLPFVGAMLVGMFVYGYFYDKNARTRP